MSDPLLNYESRTRPAPRWPRLWPRRTVAKTALAILLLLLLISLFLPTLNPRRDGWMHGNGGKCISNLRQIGLAMKLHAYDNADRLPPDLATLLSTQHLTADVFVCPSTTDERATGPTTQAILEDFAKPGHRSYVLAAPLPPTWTAVTPAHVLAYEAVGNHRSHGVTNVLFGNGRCESVDDARAVRLIAELKAGFNPPRPGR